MPEWLKGLDLSSNAMLRGFESHCYHGNLFPTARIAQLVRAPLL